MKYIYIALLVGIVTSLSSCFDLNKMPEGELSSVSSFQSIAEINKYLNQFYESAPRGQSFLTGDPSGIAFGDLDSDNLIGNVINTRLAGELSQNNAEKLANYTKIRNLNFLISNLGNCKESGPAFDQCVGEAYFFRAFYYYKMFVDYGELTWVTDVLDPVQEQMERARDSRTMVVDNILKDLNTAVENLRSQNSSASMRIHKDIALAFISEVALFEATWEKYHKMKNTPFYDKNITDDKIKSYFTQAKNAAKKVMDRGVWSISMGDVKTSYRDLFITLDLSANSEVLWWKKYDATINIGHSVTRYLNKGGGIMGASKSLVDDYLTVDGQVLTIEERNTLELNYGEELVQEKRDPRLAQTICTPGQVLRPNNQYVFELPPLDGNSYDQNTTGYSILKYVEFNTTYEPTVDGEGKSQAPAIQVRYADVLLNYAEALAELGGAQYETEIIDAIQPLRDRVGMPSLDFDREYNTNTDYAFKTLDKYIQAVRRERRVEQAFEGKRLTDILRWAAADVLILDQTPKGALFTGSNLEESYGNRLVYDEEKGNNLYLTGKKGDEKRYIIPFNNKDYIKGWQFNVNRDYLLPIQSRMISLTNNKWSQNPGWN